MRIRIAAPLLVAVLVRIVAYLMLLRWFCSVDLQGEQDRAGLRRQSMLLLARSHTGDQDAVNKLKKFRFPRSMEHKRLVNGFKGYGEFRRAVAISDAIRRFSVTL